MKICKDPKKTASPQSNNMSGLHGVHRVNLGSCVCILLQLLFVDNVYDLSQGEEHLTFQSEALFTACPTWDCLQLKNVKGS